jgi:hypothetical protein
MPYRFSLLIIGPVAQSATLDDEWNGQTSRLY